MNINIRHTLLLPTAVAVLCLMGSCIKEKDCYTAVLEDALLPQYIDSTGAVVTDDGAVIEGVYQFNNGVCVRELRPNREGKYAIPVNDCDNIEVVALASHRQPDDLNHHNPVDQTRLADMWMSVMRTTQGNIQLGSGRLWYGYWIYPSGYKPEGTVILPMYNQVAGVRFIVKNFKRWTEATEGTYTVNISGFGYAINYDGSVTYGDNGPIDYDVTTSADGDNLVSEKAQSLATPAEGRIIVELKRDGQTILSVNGDSDGNEITLLPGQSKTIVYDPLSSEAAVTVLTGDFTELPSDNVFD